MANIQVAPATTFTFHDIIIAAFERDGLLWLEANQVCRALEYANPRDAVARHVDEGDVVKHDTPTESGIQAKNYVNESGLYALIFGSKKDSAKTFKRWVTSEVLPQIRKTGGYQIKPPKTRKALAGGLSIEQQDTVKALHRELVKAAPAQTQAKLAVMLWSAVKSKFGVTYKAVPPQHYPEILSLMARVAEELPKETLPPPKPAHIVQMDFDTRESGYYHITIADGKAYRQRIMYASTAGDPYSPYNQNRH